MPTVVMSASGVRGCVENGEREGWKLTIDPVVDAWILSLGMVCTESGPNRVSDCILRGAIFAPQC